MYGDEDTAVNDGDKKYDNCIDEGQTHGSSQQQFP